MLHASMLMLHAEGGMLMLHASMLMLHAEGGMLMLHAGMLMLHAEGGMSMCHAVPSLSLFPPRNDAQQARKKRPMNLHPEEQLTESVCRQPWMTAPRSHNERASGDPQSPTGCDLRGPWVGQHVALGPVMRACVHSSVIALSTSSRAFIAPVDACISTPGVLTA